MVMGYNVCTENDVKFGRMVSEICQRTDRQTDKHTDTLIATLYIPTRGSREQTGGMVAGLAEEKVAVRSKPAE